MHPRILFFTFIISSLFSFCAGGTSDRAIGPDVSASPDSLQEKGKREVISYAGIDSVLTSLKQVPYKSIDKNFLTVLEYTGKNYEWEVADKNFYCITGKDVTKILVGKYTVKDFLPKDLYTKKLTEFPDSTFCTYALVDAEVLYIFLDLIQKLDSLAYNPYVLTIVDGFRYPKYNDAQDGAPYSQHLFGKAIDVNVGDINKDGMTDEQNDKKIVIELLDEIIGDRGGLGRYTGLSVVHFDTRGTYARWDE